MSAQDSLQDSLQGSLNDVDRDGAAGFGAAACANAIGRSDRVAEPKGAVCEIDRPDRFAGRLTVSARRAAD